MSKKLKDIKDLKVTIECGSTKVSMAVGKNEVREMMRYWKFPSFMKRFNGLLKTCKNKFLEEFIK